MFYVGGINRASPALGHDVQRHWLGDQRTEDRCEDSRAQGFMVVIITLECEVFVPLSIGHQMPNIVHQRRGDEFVSRSIATREGGALKTMLKLRDVLTVQFAALLLVKFE
jgi:hypothetical protein